MVLSFCSLTLITYVFVTEIKMKNNKINTNSENPNYVFRTSK